jgi:hypothetical protein
MIPHADAARLGCACTPCVLVPSQPPYPPHSKVPVHDARNLCDERMLTERGRFPDRLALSIEVKYLCDRGENLSHILRALCAAGDTVPAMPRR